MHAVSPLRRAWALRLVVIAYVAGRRTFDAGADPLFARSRQTGNGNKLASNPAMTHFPYLEKNVEALVKKRQPAALWLSQQRVDLDALAERLFRNRWNLLDWRMENGQGMFESLPPAFFYRDWIFDKEKSALGASIVIGCNLGYGLNHILVNTPNSHKIAVVEPNPEILVACLGQSDYTPFLNIGKLFFLPPDIQVIETAIQLSDIQFLFGQINLFLDVPSQQMGPDYSSWGNRCRASLENFSVELATLRNKQDTMVGNEIDNYQRAMADGGLEGFEGAAQGLTAVILGAGPSLADIAPRLAEQPGEALYVTALQTLPALHALGLKPHLCMAIDYSEGMRAVYERLDPEWAKDIPLLYSTKLDPQVLARYPGPTIPFWTEGGLATYVFKERQFVLDAGGNVSVTLMRLLAWLGVTRMVLAGQDFAWSGDQTHVSGHHAAQNQVAVPAQNQVTLKTPGGETVHSTLSLVTALRDMEKDIAKLGVAVHNLYGGGADIKGAAILDLDQARANALFSSAPGALPRFLERLAQARRPKPSPRFEPRALRWSSSLRNAEKRLEKLFKKASTPPQDVHNALSDVRAFLGQDPLYLPYLYNEYMDVGGLLFRAKPYEPKDFVEFKKIVKRVLGKVRRMDRVLCPVQTRDAA